MKEVFGSKYAKPRIPNPAASTSLKNLADFVRNAELRFGRPMTAPFRLGGGEIGFEDLFLNHIQHIARLERAKIRAERKEDPIRTAAENLYRRYARGRAGVLIDALARSQKISHDAARAALIRAMEDRANDRKSINENDYAFLKEIWD